jgi:hypothetical protein
MPSHEILARSVACCAVVWVGVFLNRLSVEEGDEFIFFYTFKLKLLKVVNFK